MSLKEFVDGSLMLNWAFNLGLNKRTTVFLKPILTKPIQPRSCLGLDCSFCLGCLCTRVGCGSPLALIFKKNGISGRFQTHIACHCMINKCVSSGECFFTYPGILLLLLHCFQLGSKKGTHRQQRPQLKIPGYVKKHSPEETHLLIMQWHAICVWNLPEILTIFSWKNGKVGSFQKLAMPSFSSMHCFGFATPQSCCQL